MARRLLTFRMRCAHVVVTIEFDPELDVSGADEVMGGRTAVA
jgi:hypothetical protein